MNLEDLFSLKGRVALVTGGSRGIGKMIVEGFLAAGIDRVYISARKINEIEETCAELGDRVIGIQGDLSTIDGIEALVEELSGRESKLDILVNNAGAAWGVDYLDFPEAGWDKVMDLNVKTPFFLTQKLHKLLTAGASADKPGKVINITRRMAARLVKDHIYVTSLAPGAFPSNMNRAARDHEDASAAGIPSKRVGDKFDMGGTAVYLASRAGDYTIGETLTVDGGIVNALLPTHFAEPS